MFLFWGVIIASHIKVRGTQLKWYLGRIHNLEYIQHTTRRSKNLNGVIQLERGIVKPKEMEQQSKEINNKDHWGGEAQNIAKTKLGLLKAWVCAGFPVFDFILYSNTGRKKRKN